MFAVLVAYGLAMWQPVRAWYSDADKLAHAIMFFGVYVGLVWALRWRPWVLASLAAALGAAVEVHQYFLPGFSASVADWLADLVGIAPAALAHKALNRWWQATHQHTPMNSVLPLEKFSIAEHALPLVSVDWVLTNPEGELLVGRRLNAPARDTWFTPGGRIRKGEALRAAMRRVAREELGAPLALAEAMVQRAEAMGAWDHFYPDSAFSPTVPTHYVNLPFAATLSEAEVESLRLPVGEQHGHWRWISLAQAAQEVHAHVQPYVEWLRSRAASPASSSFSSTRLAGSEITL